MGELNRALEDVEHSVDVLKACVAALRYRRAFLLCLGKNPPRRSHRPT
jgi:hypothetical protein